MCTYTFILSAVVAFPSLFPLTYTLTGVSYLTFHPYLCLDLPPLTWVRLPSPFSPYLLTYSFTYLPTYQGDLLALTFLLLLTCLFMYLFTIVYTLASAFYSYLQVCLLSGSSYVIHWLDFFFIFVYVLLITPSGYVFVALVNGPRSLLAQGIVFIVTAVVS